MNHSLHADAVKSKARRGYPDGLDSKAAIRDISVLLRRVNELERALMPFVGAGTTPNFGDTMVQVAHKDCANAANVMDRRQSEDPNVPVETFVPAEY